MRSGSDIWVAGIPVPVGNPTQLSPSRNSHCWRVACFLRTPRGDGQRQAASIHQYRIFSGLAAHSLNATWASSVISRKCGIFLSSGRPGAFARLVFRPFPVQKSRRGESIGRLSVGIFTSPVCRPTLMDNWDSSCVGLEFLRDRLGARVFGCDRVHTGSYVSQ